MNDLGIAFPGFVYFMPAMKEMYRYAVVDEARKRDMYIMCIPEKVEVLLEGVGKGIKSVLKEKFDAKVSNR